MKKLRIFAIAAMTAISMSAMAQVTYGNDYQYQPTKSSIYGSDNEAFGLFYAQYNAVTQHFSHDGYSHNENGSALSLGYSYFIPLGDMPLFIAPGAAVQWFFDSETVGNHDIKSNMISVKIPINVMYSFQVSDAFRIEPYAGIYGRVNIWGEEKLEGIGHSKTYNIFDEDDMGDDAAKRFQIGWNAGVNFRITEAFTVGAGYFMDLSKIYEHTNFQGFDITLGVNF